MRELLRSLREMLSSRTRPFIPWAVIFVGAAVLLLAFNYYVLVTYRQHVIESEQVRLSRLANAMGLTFEYVLKSTDYGMQSFAKETLSHHADDPQAIHNSLKAISEVLPFVRMTGIVGLDGMLAHSILSYPANKTFLGDRDYVFYYLKGGEAPVYFSGLNRDKVDGKWQINVSRPMRDANRMLIGIQIAAIDLDYLRKELFSNFRNIREDARGKRNHYRISVIDRDKRFIVREPETGEDIGKSLAGGPLIGDSPLPMRKRSQVRSRVCWRATYGSASRSGWPTRLLS